MAKYLVTGAAGFIGERVSDLLLADGHEVVGVDDLNNYYDVRLKNWRLERLKKRPGFTFYQQDIVDFPAVENIFKESGRFDGIINLAARAGVRASVENPWIFVNTNTTGTLNLLECSHRYGVNKFILASTSSIYGANAPLPTPEEADSSRPLQPYAASKKGAEVLSHSYHYLHGIDVTVFRYFTVYGPAGRPDMVMFRFAQWIAEGRTVHLNGNGEQSRGFTYVDDIARGTILGLKPLGYEIINLGGHETITINEMIVMLEEFIGKKARIENHPFHKADMMANWADVSKARRLLGWEPQVGLMKGIRNLVDWYLSEREWASQIETP
ncbi:MAG: NAD-dependent epimerase/dehydratase family protein [Anaerolineae bacterium]|nr:NAD-dependent epimerase/dehydratase family protein [Anaerolineae bacterium]